MSITKEKFMKIFLTITVLTALIVGSFYFIGTLNDTKDKQEEIADTTTQPLDQANKAQESQEEQSKKQSEELEKLSQE